MEGDSIGFRNYTQEDLPACVRLAQEAWPLRPGLALNARAGEMIGAWIGATVDSASWAEVAQDEHGIVGMLFAEVKGRPARKERRSTYGIEIGTFLRGLTGDYGNAVTTIRFLGSFLMTELKLLINRPRSDAEISMLIVQEGHRGKGLGKQLVDRFIEGAKKQGARSVSLYTDDQTSNWRFYEIMGFKQVAKFYDNGSSRYAGKHANALIYRMDF
jgi:ribosomal protein S18 acetylase RimI-like enzyme